MLDVSHPLVTVIIPAFRSANFIPRAIKSVTDEAGIATEVLVIDDASPDNTSEVVRKISDKHPEVRLITLKQNGGPSVARNVGIKSANGKWIAVLDADDAFESGRLSRLVAFAERETADVAADNICFYDAVTGLVSEPEMKRFNKSTELGVELFVSAARPRTGDLDLGLLKPLYRRSFLLEAGLFYPEGIRHGEDFRFYFDLLMAGARFMILPTSGYLWTRRSSGQSQTKVDYESQSREAIRLSRLPNVRSNSRLVDLLKLRAKVLSNLSLDHTFREMRKHRHLSGVALFILRHPMHAARYCISRICRVVR